MTEAVVPEGVLPVSVAPTEPATLSVHGLADQRSVRDWLLEHRVPLRTELLRHGHLLVRGLPPPDPESFAAIRDVLVDSPATHAREETTPRSSYGDGVFSATDLPPEQTIRLHNEDSYSVVFPGVLMFACLTPAERGGATTVGDVRRVLHALPADVVDRFRRRGWLMTRNFTDHVGLPWQRAFGTTERQEVERFCAAQQVGCAWLADDRLRTTSLRAATIRHPRTGEESWFNHIAVFHELTHDPQVRAVLLEAFGPDGLPQNTRYGDGEPIEPDVVDALNRAYDEVTVPVRWREGDLLLVDNVLSAHGREPYRGRREVLVAMGDPLDVADCAPSSPTGATPRTPGEGNP